jgi:hypothetical protein
MGRAEDNVKVAKAMLKKQGKLRNIKDNGSNGI